MHLAAKNCYTSYGYMNNQAGIILVRELLKHGASLDVLYLGKNPTELCLELYKKHPKYSNIFCSLMNIFFEFGHSPNQNVNGKNIYLEEAIKREDREFINLLLKYNVDLSVPNKLLVYAIKKKDLPYILDIIKRGAKIGPSHLAAAFEVKNYNLIPILLQNGGVIDSTVVASVIKANDLEGLKILKELGANLQQKDNPIVNQAVYSTKFIYSTTEPSIIEFLVKECGWDVNFKDQYNQTPLYKAYAYKNFQAILVLLQLGASLESRLPHKNWFSLREYFNMDKDLVEYLRRYGYYIDNRC